MVNGEWIHLKDLNLQFKTCCIRISEVDYDIVHIQHKPVAERVLSMYPELDKICTIHSEVMSRDLENPVLDSTI